MGLRKPSFAVPGCDFAGVVEAVDKDVTTVRPGDEVFASRSYLLPAFGLTELAKITAIDIRRWLAGMRGTKLSASLSAIAGATTKELMARMGHSSPRAALIYQHATAERDGAIAEALDRLVAGTLAASSRPERPVRLRPAGARGS